MAGANYIKWRDRNWSEHGHYIYRSLTPMDVSNMPAHIAITEPNVTEYVDTDVIEGTEYFYRIGVYRNNDIAISPEMSMVSENNAGPGSQVLMAGDPSGDGFYGEVLGTEAGLWTGDELAAELGLTAGTSQYSDEPYLKFQLDGTEILYVSKKPLRHSISWDQIQAVNAVYGDRIISKDGFSYEVTLLKGAASDPYTGVDGYDEGYTHGSEWNRLMYHIHDGNHTNSRGINTLASEGITVGDWASYTDAELLTGYTYGDGTVGWCQETRSSSVLERLSRGVYGVSNSFTDTSYYNNTNRGWRPALRLIR